MKRDHRGDAGAVLIRHVGLIGSTAILALAGCASAGHRAEAAADVAVRLLTAVQNQDGGGACALLAPETLKQVAEEVPCAKAILDTNLPEPAGVRGTDVY